MRKPFVMGNWKLNGNKATTGALVTQLKHHLATVKDCEVAIAPPVMYLDYAYELLANSNITLGAQNVDTTSFGAYTGDISAAMLKEIGVKYVIIGHSERRHYHKESDAIIAKKFAALKAHELTPVLCIGETEAENQADETEFVCAKQIDAIFHELGANAFNNAVVAYEPIWAIGTGKSATPAQAESIHKFIRQHISEKDPTVATHLIIQYGGSVNEINAAELFSQPNIDGALVGGASLKADSFSAIVKAAAHAKNSSTH